MDTFHRISHFRWFADSHYVSIWFKQWKKELYRQKTKIKGNEEKDIFIEFDRYYATDDTPIPIFPSTNFTLQPRQQTFFDMARIFS
jgi:hypothetical protein